MLQALKSVGMLLLALLIALTGGRVDLCACDEASHGFLCSDVPAPAVEPVSACCSGTSRGAEPASSTPQLRSPDCGCPVLDLTGSVAEASVAPPTAGHAHVLASASSASQASFAVATWIDSSLLRPRGVRERSHASYAGTRHLELHVLRC